ncbi:MAG: M13 family metallopeptidase, partial [Duncaniella sp.]|nr:M13 family metallopeptidase [Duncaniella sp.]
MKATIFPAIAMTLAFATTSCSHGGGEHLASLNAAYIDTTIPAGQDFYTRINKGWMEANPLTAEHARYGQFDIINDSCESRVKSLVEGLGATNPEPGSVADKVWTLYSQAMDTARRNAEGATPILADLKKIEETPADGMTDLFFWMHANYGSPFFGAGPMEDLTNSTVYAMYLDGTGLGMGDRDYYLLDDERNTAVRNAYKTLITTQMQNAGYTKEDAERITANVMKIETALAKDSKTREERRNIPAMYNPFTIAQVKETYPSVNWDR